MLFLEKQIEKIVSVIPHNSIQTGYVYNPTLTLGFGNTETYKYCDVLITEVDVEKSLCVFDGKSTAYVSGVIDLSDSSHAFGVPTCYLSDSTHIRLCTTTGYSYMAGVWYVIEFA